MRHATVLIASLCAALLLAACNRTPEAQPETVTVEPAAPEPAPAPAAATIDEKMLSAEPAPGNDNRVPEPFHGTWDESPASCREASEVRLVIGAEQLRFHEGTGQVETVRVVADNDIVLRVAMQGQGQRWQATERYALSADGSELYDRGQEPAFTRVRCSR